MSGNLQLDQNVDVFSLLAAAVPCLQIMLNPFHTASTRITSKPFDQKVKMLAKRMLA